MSALVLAAGAWLLIVQGLSPTPTVPRQPAQPYAHDGSTSEAEQELPDVEPTDEDQAESAEEDMESVEEPATDASPVVEDISAALESMTIEAPRHRASDRTERDLDEPITLPLCTPEDLGLLDGAGRPVVLEPRWELGAALLGGLVGFGTGDFYAGNHRHGLVLAIADTVLLAGLAGSVWALNEHVVDEDRRTGLSLKRGERERDGTESTLTGLAWGLGVAAGLSRLFQVYDGYHSAVRTNEAIAKTSFVPLASVSPLRHGGAVTLGFTW